jgi:hypothetical protein
MIGLIQAVDRFDPDWHLKLKTLPNIASVELCLITCVALTLCPEVFVASKKQRDAVIDAFSVAGKVPAMRGSRRLSAFRQQNIAPSRIIRAAEPISIHESAIAEELAG